MNEDIQLTAKIKLDTADFENQLKSVSETKVKSAPVEVALPKDQKIKLPKDATKSLKELFSGPKASGNMGKLAKDAMGGLNGITGSLSGMLPQLGFVAAAIGMIIKLLQGTDTMDMMVNSITNLFDTLRTAMAPTLSAIGEVVKVVVDILAALLPVLNPIFESLRTALLPIIALLKILQPLVNLFMKLQEIFQSITNIFTDTLTGLLESVLSITVDLVEAGIKPLLEFLQPVVEFFGKIKTAIQDFITSITFGLITFDKKLTSTDAALAAPKVKSSLDIWETTSGETPAENSARMAAESAASAAEATEGADSTLNKLLKVVEELKNFLTNLWKGVSDLVSNLWTTVKTAVTTMWENAKNFVSSVLSSIWGGVKNVATTAWSGIQTVFGKGWLWEDGGTLGIGAQVWGMNEKGNPEFMFNAGGHDSVINAKILENAMYNAYVRAKGVETTRLEVSVKEGTPAGPRELVQWILPSLKVSL